MAKQKLTTLPLDTEIEVFAFKGDVVIKRIMTYAEWIDIKRKPGWKYDAYEKGFCSIKEKNG
jgi:hypothetical protein